MAVAVFILGFRFWIDFQTRFICGFMECLRESGKYVKHWVYARWDFSIVLFVYISLLWSMRYSLPGAVVGFAVILLIKPKQISLPLWLAILFNALLQCWDLFCKASVRIPSTWAVWRYWIRPFCSSCGTPYQATGGKTRETERKLSVSLQVPNTTYV